MSGSIKVASTGWEKGNRAAAERFTLEAAKKALTYHQSFPEYSATPLVCLEQLADLLGVDSIYVKDESYRFGLNAFKVLGGSYCIGAYIAEQLGLDIGEISYELIKSDEIRQRLGKVTFVTATDGNHGRGIAWTANQIGQRSVVYMPNGSAGERLDHIRRLGADASITSLNYDDTVRMAEQKARENGWVIVQDTDWEGYTKIPGLIMQGYTTMALEVLEQLKGIKPTHIFLQAGVGAMAGAVAGFFANVYPGAEKPVIVIVEPDRADCLYQSAKAGIPQAVTGSLDTIMAGLACGEPCAIGWKVLKYAADHFVSMPDYVAAAGMRVLGNPAGSDQRIISGESGAAGLGLVVEMLQNKSRAALKEQLGLNLNSKILCFSTEGDTDQESYRQIVWNGRFNRYNGSGSNIEY